MTQTAQYIVKYSMHTPVNRFKSQTPLHKLGIQHSLHKVLARLSEVSSDSKSVVNFTIDSQPAETRSIILFRFCDATAILN